MHNSGAYYYSITGIFKLLYSYINIISLYSSSFIFNACLLPMPYCVHCTSSIVIPSPSPGVSFLGPASRNRGGDSTFQYSISTRLFSFMLVVYQHFKRRTIKKNIEKGFHNNVAKSTLYIQGLVEIPSTGLLTLTITLSQPPNGLAISRGTEHLATVRTTAGPITMYPNTAFLNSTRRSIPHNVQEIPNPSRLRLDNSVTS